MASVLLLVSIFSSLAAHVKGIRDQNIGLGPGDDFKDGVEAAISIQDPEYDHGRTADAFKLLYKGYNGVSTEVLDQLGPSSEAVLHFLLNFYKFGRIHRNQIEAVVKRSTGEKGSSIWAEAAASKPVRRHLLSVLQSLGVSDSSLGALEKRGTEKVAEFLGCFGTTVGELSSLEEEEAQPALEAEAAEELLEPEPLQTKLEEEESKPDPLKAKLEHAIAKVRTMSVPREFQNRREEAFSDFRRAVLLLRGSEHREELLSLSKADAHLAWDFLLRWASDRKVYRSQVAEVASILIASSEWKAELLNDTKLVEAALACPAVEVIREQLRPVPPEKGCTDLGQSRPGDGVRRVRLLLTRVHLCQKATALFRSSRYLPSGSWAGCGIQGVQWVGAEPYHDALFAATYGFGPEHQAVHAAPFLGNPAIRGPLAFLDEPEPAERVAVAGASWALADAAEAEHPAATGERDWARFEDFLAKVVVSSIGGGGADSSEEPAVAVVVSDEIIKEAFGRRWEWWNGYRSTLCRRFLNRGDIPEILEVMYEVVDGRAVALAKRPDGSPNCRAVANCTCFK